MKMKQLGIPNFDRRFTAFTSPIPSTPENHKRYKENKISATFFFLSRPWARELRHVARLRTDQRELDKVGL